MKVQEAGYQGVIQQHAGSTQKRETYANQQPARVPLAEAAGQLLGGAQETQRFGLLVDERKSAQQTAKLVMALIKQGQMDWRL